MIGAAMAGSAGRVCSTPNPVGALIGGLLSALIGWAVWSYVIYFVGTRFFGGHGDLR